MDAIKLLEQQHHEVEALFAKAENAKTPAQRQRVFEQVGDALAVHATIEEKIFYPSIRAASTEDLLFEAVEEHLAAKRIIADLIALSPRDEHYAAKISVLKEAIFHHVKEERKEMFPKARKLLDKDQLTALGEQMEAMVTELRASTKAPRLRVPAETAHAAELR